MPNPQCLTQRKQLLVEGQDPVYFFRALLKHLNITDVQIQNYGGIKDLRVFLKTLSITPDFATLVTSVGIVRDAETNAASAFQSVRDAIKAANLPQPKQPIIPTEASPQVSILILPDATVVADDKNPQMLENLCLRTVENDPVMECIEQYFTCVEQRLGILPKNIPKARLQAFLASRLEPGLLLGQAASKGYWIWDSPAMDIVKEFIQTLR